MAALIATYAADKAIVDLAAAQSAITENSEWTRGTTDDHQVTITTKPLPKSTGGGFASPGIVTGDEAAIVK